MARGVTALVRLKEFRDGPASPAVWLLQMALAPLSKLEKRSCVERLGAAMFPGIADVRSGREDRHDSNDRGHGRAHAGVAQTAARGGHARKERRRAGRDRAGMTQGRGPEAGSGVSAKALGQGRAVRVRPGGGRSAQSRSGVFGDELG